MSKILITGASGHLGAAVTKKLLDKVSADKISVLVRNPSKAEEFKSKGINVIVGSYDDYSSLLTAFKGVDKLYFVSGSDIVNRIKQQENVVKAAIEAKVGHIIYTSFQRKTEDETSPIALVASAHINTEQQIKKSGLTYTILKHGLYADVLPMFLGNNVLETGTIFLPAGNGKTSFATRNDMADAAVTILTTSGHENKSYEITGSAAYSFNDIASILSELSGKTIQYISPAPEAFVEQLKKFGVPEEGIQGALSFALAIAKGEFDSVDSALEKLIGHKPTSLKDYIKSAYFSK